MQYVVNRNDAEPGMATADEVERALQKAVANGLPPLKRLYHKGKAEPMAADAEPKTEEEKTSPATEKAILSPTSRRA